MSFCKIRETSLVSESVNFKDVLSWANIDMSHYLFVCVCVCVCVCVFSSFLKFFSLFTFQLNNKKPCEIKSTLGLMFYYLALCVRN